LHGTPLAGVFPISTHQENQRLLHRIILPVVRLSIRGLCPKFGQD
jgi:hypothetical protein